MIHRPAASLVRGALLALSALVIIAPPRAEAQLPEVQAGEIRVFTDFGGIFPIRTFSSNQAEIIQESVVQGAADVFNSMLIGIGGEYALGDPSVRLRASYRQTLGLTTGGNLLPCKAFNPPPQDPLHGPCNEVFEVDGTLREFMAEIVFVQGRSGARVRPTIIGGLGFRGYDFETLSCDQYGIGVTLNVCERMAEIWEEEAAFNPFMTLGFGFEVKMGTPRLILSGRGVVGPYNGGQNRASGDTQMDITATAAISFPVKR